MKTLLTAALLLASSTAFAQKHKNTADVLTPILPPTYYQAKVQGVAYHRLKDTLDTSPQVPALSLAPGDRVLAMGTLGNRWVKVVREGVSYFVRLANVTPADDDAQIHASEEQATSPSGYSPGHQIQTGPRGGKYYINSNGNKSYIRRK